MKLPFCIINIFEFTMIVMCYANGLFSNCPLKALNQIDSYLTSKWISFFIFGVSTVAVLDAAMFHHYNFRLE